MKDADFEDSFMDGDVVAEDVGAVDGGGVEAGAAVVTPLDVIQNVGENHRGVGWGVTGR